MSGRELPDFAGWSLRRLSGQRADLERILAAMAGQDDPLKPRLRSELEAIRAEIGRREAGWRVKDHRYKIANSPEGN